MRTIDKVVNEEEACMHALRSNHKFFLSFFLSYYLFPPSRCFFHCLLRWKINFFFSGFFFLEEQLLFSIMLCATFLLWQRWMCRLLVNRKKKKKKKNTFLTIMADCLTLFHCCSFIEEVSKQLKNCVPMIIHLFRWMIVRKLVDRRGVLHIWRALDELP